MRVSPFNGCERFQSHQQPQSKNSEKAPTRAEPWSLPKASGSKCSSGFRIREHVLEPLPGSSNQHGNNSQTPMVGCLSVKWQKNEPYSHCILSGQLPATDFSNSGIAQQSHFAGMRQLFRVKPTWSREAAEAGAKASAGARARAGARHDPSQKWQPNDKILSESLLSRLILGEKGYPSQQQSASPGGWALHATAKKGTLSTKT